VRDQPVEHCDEERAVLFLGADPEDRAVASIERAREVGLLIVAWGDDELLLSTRQSRPIFGLR